MKKFPQTFWVANIMELFERWAFYGFYMLFANYLTMSVDAGALGFTQSEKGIIMGVGTFILYLLPLITGAISDKIGFKKTLFIAYFLYFIAFLIMPYCRSFMAVFFNYLFLAVAAALFKPIVSATIAQTVTKENSSIGFGIFYMMINIGAFIGPLVALQFSSNDFQKVFYVSALLIFLNALVLIFYKEPYKTKNDDNLGKAILKILKNIITALSDIKLVLFLLIIAGFWTMYYQLFFTLPVFITQWVDIETLNQQMNTHIPWLIKILGGSDSSLKAEHITNMDALFIIIFQLIVSSTVMKWKPINTIITGMFVASIGMGLTLFTNNVGFLLLGIFIFGIGEMTGSPKITEYIGLIAPKDKVALYMGSSFLPVALGSFFGGLVSGSVYQKMSDKTSFIQQEFTKKGMNIDISQLTQNELFEKIKLEWGMQHTEFTAYLWEKYQPHQIWIVVFGIGFFSVIAMWIYSKYLSRYKKQNP